MARPLDPNSPEATLYALLFNNLQELATDVRARLDEQDRMLRDLQAQLSRIESEVLLLRR